MRGGIGALDMRRSRAWVLGLDQGGHLIWRLVGSLGLDQGGHFIWRLVEGGERIVKGERERGEKGGGDDKTMRIRV